MFALEIDNMNDIYSFLVACCGPRLERLFVQLPTSGYEYWPEDELSGSESEENGSVEELSEQEATEEDELDEDLSEGKTLEKDGLEEEQSEGDALEEDELEEELSERDDLDEELSEGDDLEDGDGFENLLLVNMMNFKGRHHELQLVSLFLKKSTSLNQLILFTPKINHPEWLQKDHINTSHILERKLSPLRKASPNVQIVLSEPDDSAIQPLHEAFVKV